MITYSQSSSIEQQGSNPATGGIKKHTKKEAIPSEPKLNTRDTLMSSLMTSGGFFTPSTPFNPPLNPGV